MTRACDVDRSDDFPGGTPPLGGPLTRRRFLAGGGALVVSFSLLPGSLQAQESETAREEPQNQGEVPKQAPKLPGSLENNPMLDAWIRIDADGTITVFTGKIELGQGIKTALIQVAAEELVVPPARITLVTADTAITPNEGYTAGSQSMQHSGTAILHAAAQVRGILTGLAAERLGVPQQQLVVGDARVRAPDGRALAYGELVAGKALHVRAQPRSPLRDPGNRAVMGKALPRVDIPAKVTGGAAYVQDFRPPGMVHARVVRPPSYGARLAALDTAPLRGLPGVLQVVRDGSFVAVVAEQEHQAIAALRALAAAARWEEKPTIRDDLDPYENIWRLPSIDKVHVGQRTAPLSGDGVVSATYRRPYTMHASIGPSCAVAQAEGGEVTVWTHSQGVYPLREGIAQMLNQPLESVRCVHLEGSGCYGHNGADDVAADAALIARSFPGRPVRVQWMREDEHGWEPFGSAMVASVQGRVENGKVAAWRYEVWSHSHLTRPGPAGNLLPAWHLERPFPQPEPEPLPLPAGGGDRNSLPTYRFDDASIVYHFVPAMPVRVSALRALGGYANVFAIESFMDELAASAGIDPVEFRLRHLEDSRAADVVRRAAERFGWSTFQRERGRGRGFGFARYKTLAAYCAVACEIEVERDTGRTRVVRAVAAVDSGEAVNPDGLRNQIEGGIVQSISWTLHEAVRYDDTRITSRDWAGYPILRFRDLPDTIEVHVIDRPGAPFLGTGEAAQGPAAAALANAFADATGRRLRDLPFDRRRVRAMLAA